MAAKACLSAGVAVWPAWAGGMMSADGLTKRLGGRRGFFLAAFLAGFLEAVVMFPIIVCSYVSFTRRKKNVACKISLIYFNS